MKKIILGLCALTLLIIACQDNSQDSINQEDFSQIEVDMSDFYVYTDTETDDLLKSANENERNCQSMQVLNRQLKENPGLERKMYNVELHTRKFLAGKGKPTNPGSGGGDTEMLM